MPYAVVPVVMTSVPVVMPMSFMTVIIVCSGGIPVIVNMSIAMFVLMSISFVVFVGVAMTFPAIVLVNMPQVMWALGFLIMVVPVDMPRGCRHLVCPSIFLKSYLLFGLTIMAVNVFPALLIRMTVPGQSMALSARGFVGVGR